MQHDKSESVSQFLAGKSNQSWFGTYAEPRKMYIAYQRGERTSKHL